MANPVRIKGDPDALDAFTSDATTTLSSTSTDITAYGTAASGYINAASDISTALTDRSAAIDEAVAALTDTVRTPAGIGALLRQLDADHDGDVDTHELPDGAYVDAFLTAWLANPDATPETVANLATMARGAELGEEMAAIVEGEESELSDEERIEAVLEQLAIYEDDPLFTAAFFEELGPERTAQLPVVFEVAYWDGVDSEEYDNPHDYTPRPSTFDANAAIDQISRALGSASEELGRDFREDVFASGVPEDDGYALVTPSFVALFRAGTFAEPWAEDIGQLGIDLLSARRGDGEIESEPGAGPYFTVPTDSSGQYEDNVEELASALLTTSSRTPGAANDLLVGEDGNRNAWILTDYDFQRGDDGGGGVDPEWDQVADGVNAFLTAGTVAYGETSPYWARVAAANVIEHGTRNLVPDDDPDDEWDYDGDGYDRANAEALTPTWAAISEAYLGDFALSSRSAERVYVDEGLIRLPTMEATRVLSLAMRDEEARARLVARHAELSFQLAVAGIANERLTGEGLPVALGQLDGLMYASHVAAGYEEAEALDAAAAAHNASVNQIAGLVTGPGFTVLKLWDPAESVLSQPGASDVTAGIQGALTSLFHQPIGAVDAFEVDATQQAWDTIQLEQNTVALGGVVVAMAHEQGGVSSPDQQLLLEVAREELGASYDALHAVVTSDTPPTQAQIEAIGIDPDDLISLTDRIANGAATNNEDFFLDLDEYGDDVAGAREEAMGIVDNGNGVWP